MQLDGGYGRFSIEPYCGDKLTFLIGINILFYNVFF